MKNQALAILTGLCVSLLTADAIAQTTVVRADRLLDVETGRIVNDATVVIDGDRIVSVGGRVPAGAQVIDLGDLTLLPGLMDLHTHLTYDLEGDWVNRPVKEGPADYALRGAYNAPKTLLAGFTTVRDVGAYGLADVALMRAIENGFVVGNCVLFSVVTQFDGGKVAFDAVTGGPPTVIACLDEDGDLDDDGELDEEDDNDGLDEDGDGADNDEPENGD